MYKVLLRRCCGSVSILCASRKKKKREKTKQKKTALARGERLNVCRFLEPRMQSVKEEEVEEGESNKCMK